MITLNTNSGLLRTAVYERILSDLQQGAIAPGETISLNKLAETLNISKTPLRDAESACARILRSPDVAPLFAH